MNVFEVDLLEGHPPVQVATEYAKSLIRRIEIVPEYSMQNGLGDVEKEIQRYIETLRSYDKCEWIQLREACLSVAEANARVVHQVYAKMNYRDHHLFAPICSATTLISRSVDSGWDDAMVRMALDGAKDYVSKVTEEAKKELQLIEEYHTDDPVIQKALDKVTLRSLDTSVSAGAFVELSDMMLDLFSRCQALVAIAERG